jgi:hypothetical protein
VTFCDHHDFYDHLFKRIEATPMNKNIRPGENGEMDRRAAIQGGLIASALFAGTGLPAMNASTATAAKAGALQQEEDDKDTQAVMAAGMTAEEAKCWKLIAEAAGAFFALPELHPMDKTEVATAIHVVQNKLLGRPVYRKYLEAAKALR